MADFTGVTNPKRVINKRMVEAGEETAPPAVKTGGAMSQSDFGGRKLTEAERLAQQRKLAEMLKNRK